MSLKEKFDKAVNVIRNLPKSGSYQPSHELQLRFYSYYKQATEGPNPQPRPSFWEVVKRAKWDAWSKLGNMTKDEAMMHYIEELRKIVETMSYTDNVANFVNSLDNFYDNVPAEDLEMLVGPIIEKIRSRPNSPLHGSPLASRDTSPSRDLSPLRLHSRAATVNGATKHITSSLETSPASSYSASPQPPDTDDDDDDEHFLDTRTEPDREKDVIVKKARSDEASVTHPTVSEVVPGKLEPDPNEDDAVCQRARINARVAKLYPDKRTEPDREKDGIVKKARSDEASVNHPTVTEVVPGRLEPDPNEDDLVYQLARINARVAKLYPDKTKMSNTENCNGVIPNDVRNESTLQGLMVTREAFKKAIGQLTEELESLQRRMATLENERPLKNNATTVHSRGSAAVSKWWDLSLPTTAALLMWPVFILLMSKWMSNRRRH